MQAEHRPQEGGALRDSGTEYQPDRQGTETKTAIVGIRQRSPESSLLRLLGRALRESPFLPDHEPTRCG
jgi:hypothetical protein